MKIFSLMENEINAYLTQDTEISEGYRYSQYKVIKRLMLYANCVFPKGKLNKLGQYKYWIDISAPRIDNDVKNTDFDTRDIFLSSNSEKDTAVILLCNLYLQTWLRDNAKAVELNEAIEEGAGWGNVVWKKIHKGYEKVDLKNLYVINQTAKTLQDTPVIERHIVNQSYLRTQSAIWDNVEEVIKNCGNKGFSATPQGIIETKETPYYEIYVRNGEISEAELFEARGKTGGSETKYFLSKVICAGLSKSSPSGSKYVLFADKIDGMPYKEYHRGRYHGRWLRLGLYEILFDIQTRANEISTQIARGLEWASKTFFRSQDRLFVQNITTQMSSGEVIRSTDLQQIPVRMEGLDQLIADWNRLMITADKLCNSYEILMGEMTPAGTSFKLGAMINQNANKFYDFIREKLSLALQSVFQDWVLEDLMKDLKKEKVLKLTGDENSINRFYEILVNSWYLRNLLALPAHSSEQATLIKQSKLTELLAKPEKFIALESGWLDNVKPRVNVVISGENTHLITELETLASFIALEQDPVRRSYLIQLAMKKKGIDVENMPRSTPEQLTGKPEQLMSMMPGESSTVQV